MGSVMINSFKWWVLNINKVPSAKSKKKPLLLGARCYNDRTNSYLQVASLLSTISFSALRTLLHQLIRLCINIHSNKILLTPSGHLKHGPCGHHVIVFVNPHEHTPGSSASSFGHHKFWGFSQFLYFITWTQSGTSHLLHPPPSLQTPSDALHASAHPTPRWI